MKRTYESMFIINQSEKEKIAETIEKVKTFITKKKGTILDVNERGTRKLAYEIKHKNEGYYVIIYFTLDAKYISALENFYKLDNDIIRFIVINQEDKKNKISEEK